jgi:murein DD-endopeptidase MepM/ murein hydrolase activator NlpD
VKPTPGPARGIAAALVAAIVFFSAPAVRAEDLRNWQEFERRVRDGAVSEPEGVAEIARWHAILARACPAEGFGRRVFFPLKNYGPNSIGGKNGEGFRPAGYAFLIGNRHRGHPAQDIFVHDRNQDGADDRTGGPVAVLAIADGVVLSTFSAWVPEEPFGAVRGGNYIWLFHPALGLFSYYAHLREVEVAAGDTVAGGEPIATLGRTGTNAFPARSPTHLHLMLLRARDMTPVDPYPLLRRDR